MGACARAHTQAGGLVIDLEALRLELAIANAARRFQACICHCAPNDPETVDAVLAIGRAVEAAELYANPPAKECRREGPE